MNYLNKIMGLRKKEGIMDRTKGEIEKLEGSKLHGWFYDGETYPKIPKVVLSDDLGTRLIQCKEYRKEFSDMPGNNGYCGFSENIYGEYRVYSECGKHELSRSKNYSENLTGNISDVKKELLSTINHVVVNSEPETSKVAIISSFLPDPTFYSYQKDLITRLKSEGYYTVYVLPENEASPHGKDYFEDIYDDADVIINRKNFGYDFGSYATGYAYISKNREADFDSVVFCNDSIVGTNEDMEFLRGIDSYPFWGVTESYEHQYHVQSYFFGFNLDVNVKVALDDFLFGRGHVYTNDKDLVIKRFELAMTSFFQRKGINCHVVFPLEMLMRKYFEEEELYLDLDREKFSAYFNVVFNKLDFNVSHFLWRELYMLGFPFIKKELIRYNPTSYPYFHYLLRKTVNSSEFGFYTTRCF